MQSGCPFMRRGDFLVCALQDSGRVCFSTACLATQRRFYGLLLASLGGGRRLDRQSPTQLPTLVNQTAKNFQLSEVSADKGYSSFDNHEAITKAGAVPYIAFKANATGEVGGMFQKMYHFYCFKRDEFLRSYHKRSTEFRPLRRDSLTTPLGCRSFLLFRRPFGFPQRGGWRK